FLPIAQAAGIHLVARGSEVTPKFIRVCTITSGRILHSRRADAVRFLTAEMQALRFALANRDKEVALTRDITGAAADDPRPDFMFEEALRPGTGVDPAMPIPLDRLAWSQDELIKAGNMKQPFDLTKMIDADVRVEALGKAGIN